jgi:hypothetical protein
LPLPKNKLAFALAKNRTLDVYKLLVKNHNVAEEKKLYFLGKGKGMG